MKILIISKIFYPTNRIGAIRPTNFAIFLAKMGHSVTVITENVSNGNSDFLQDDLSIYRFSNYNFIAKIVKSRNKNRKPDIKVNKVNKEFHIKKKESYFYRLRLLRMIFFNLLVEVLWYFKVKGEFKKLEKESTYDIVISSFGPLSSFLLGRWVKKEKIAKKWASDFRDIMTSSEYPYFLNKYFLALQKYAIKNADYLFFVSKGQRNIFNDSLKKIQTELFNKNYVIYNGYEKSLDTIKSSHTNDDVLKFAYTGQLYIGRSSFEMLFKVIEDLIVENFINPEKILIEYAGQSGNYFLSQVNKYENLVKRVINHGFIERSKAMEIQSSSDILIALTWNTKQEQGILTGKFLEYMQFQKPIVALTTGDLPNGELTTIIRDLNLGISCEYINYNRDHHSLKQFVKELYISKQSKFCVEYSADYSKICKFHYSEIVKELEGIINSVDS